jgi:hypothetical protein
VEKVTEDAEVRLVEAEDGVRRIDFLRADSCVIRFLLCNFFDESGFVFMLR